MESKNSKENIIIKTNGNIHYIKGDIFQSQMQTLVNPVNCRGVMGAGLALKFKEKFPNMYTEYVKCCQTKRLRIGRPTLWKGEKWVLNFPTKDDWRAPSKLEWIEEGLKYFVANYKKAGITSIAFPCLGCNLGGLFWLDVKEIMYKFLSKIDIPVEIYLPKLTSIESFIVYLIEDIVPNFQDKLYQVSIQRMIFPFSDKWIDWKKTKELTIQILLNSKIASDFINSLESNKTNSFKKLLIDLIDKSKLENNKTSLLFKIRQKT